MPVVEESQRATERLRRTSRARSEPRHRRDRRAPAGGRPLGARVEDLSAADAAVLVRAGIVPTAPNGFDDPMRLAVLPEHWSGWGRPPGVSGSRSGVAWSPKFTTTALRVDGAEVPAGQTVVNRAGPAAVSDAVDEVAELELRVDVEMLPGGLV